LVKPQIFKRLQWIGWGLGLSCLATPAFGLSNSMGEAGIDALKLRKAPYNLTGRKIAIGQVEIGRPGVFGLDKALSWNPAIAIAQVFHIDNPAQSNVEVDPHATMVAGIMVSAEKAFPGVAPGARLYSSAVGSPKTSGQAEECLSAQHIALQNSQDVRAINFSFGESLQRDSRPEATLDGNALLTQCIDWSSSTHNTLYVIAGNQGSGGIPIPTDNFNGVNVAYSTRREGIFTKVDFTNLSANPEGIGKRLINREINVGGRRSISLAAPGSQIELLDLEGKKTRVSGTSFAAPHVAGVIALLQELGDRQIRLRQPQWSLSARRHEVMKAVLLNSAEKIKDEGDGLTLGMSRTILTKDNRDWRESDAYSDRKIPLDYQMGTGHLNAFRAYEQFSPGQWSPDTAVPPIGWDYRQVEEGNFKDYVLDKPLQEGSFVSITLAWDRKVELEDKNSNGIYDVGEKFSDRGLNTLDIYLMRAEDDDPGNSIWSSESDVDSVQHIFHQVPSTGKYKIRVKYRQRVNDPVQSYAIAWWTLPSRTN
jgi:Subtilase family